MAERSGDGQSWGKLIWWIVNGIWSNHLDWYGNYCGPRFFNRCIQHRIDSIIPVQSDAQNLSLEQFALLVVYETICSNSLHQLVPTNILKQNFEDSFKFFITKLPNKNDFVICSKIFIVQVSIFNRATGIFAFKSLSELKTIHMQNL